jgi:ABC-type transport system involved in cytochrome c biogenesis permease subunit
VYTLGSLRLAMALLSVLLIACAAATVSESRLSTRVAQYYIYNAPWFHLWLAILCVNLFMVTMTRLPWERRHTGFIVTHYGIILLLAGAMVGHYWGFEGTLTLDKGGAPQTRVIENSPQLLVQPESTGEIFMTPMDPEVRTPRPERERVLPLPGTRTRVVLDAFSKELGIERELEPAPPGGPAAVDLTLVTAMVPQPVRMQLLGRGEDSKFDLFGRGRVEWLAELPPPPPPVTNAPSFRETHLVLLRQPDGSISHNSAGEPSGFGFTLMASTNSGRWILGLRTPSGQVQAHPLENVWRQPLRVDELEATVSVQEFWADFVMTNGAPASASEEPRNPAVLVHVTGRIDPKSGNLERVLQLAPAGTNGVVYRSLRGGAVVAEGRAAAGESFRIGWADWSATVGAVLESGRLRERVAETKGSGPAPRMGPGRARPLTGVRARLRAADGSESDRRWIVLGTGEKLVLGGEAFRIGYGLRTRPLGFGVTLENFEVPRQPGTEEPADFVSTVRFRRLTDGLEHGGVVRMNHPQSFPPGLVRALGGWNYKFSQAGWDPSQLTQTTLQVLHDPGWWLKWVGSLAICVGITIMFYWKPAGPKRANGTPHSGGVASRTAVAVMLAWMMLALAPHAQAGTNAPGVGIPWKEIETLPIQHRGRVKPFLAFAQETLTTLHGSPVYRGADGRVPAVEAVLDMWIRPEEWAAKPLILVEYGPLREAMGLSREEKRFAARDLAGNQELARILGEAARAPAGETGDPELTPMQSAARKVEARLNRAGEVLGGGVFTVVAPQSGVAWEPLGSASPDTTPGRSAIGMLARAWPGDARGVARAAGLLNAELTRQAEVVGGVPASRVHSEWAYLKWRPFHWAYYACFAGIACAALLPLVAKRLAYPALWVFALIAFGLQVAGLAWRVQIAGRAPVTNMYETVIWLAAGVTLFALILEAAFRCRYYLLCALPLAGAVLILADMEPAVLDSSINPLVPVLQSNFWLTIHVLTVTSSYAAFALALVVAHVALVQASWMRNGRPEALFHYVYRALQIGVLLLAAGTILGGVWANYSWGRFWGWDPKETWAFISLLGYLLILHGRIAGWWRGFGVAVGAVLAFQLVLMTWYGVNFILGKGLHSYGRGSGGMEIVVGYLALEAVFLLAVLLTRRRAAGAAGAAS